MHAVYYILPLNVCTYCKIKFMKVIVVEVCYRKIYTSACITKLLFFFCKKKLSYKNLMFMRHKRHNRISKQTVLFFFGVYENKKGSKNVFNILLRYYMELKWVYKRKSLVWFLSQMFTNIKVLYTYVFASKLKQALEHFFG